MPPQATHHRTATIVGQEVFYREAGDPDRRRVG
jgi:hypothetical protein